MRICSLESCDITVKRSGSATADLSKYEVRLLADALYETTKGKTGIPAKRKLAREFKLLNALVQHGGLDSVEVSSLQKIDMTIKEDERLERLKNEKRQPKT